MQTIITQPKEELLHILWSENPKIKKILEHAQDLTEARNNLFDYLYKKERRYFNIYSGHYSKETHIIEKNNAKECIRILKNIIRTENEKLTHFSAFHMLYNLAKGKDTLSQIHEGFLCEFIFLFRGMQGKSTLSYNELLSFDSPHARSCMLDKYSKKMEETFQKYKAGTDAELVKKSIALKQRILRYFNATEKDWKNFSWQLKHVIRDAKTLSTLVTLNKEEHKGVLLAEKYNIPFHITPYYLSLFNETGKTCLDRAIRAQVIPSATYCIHVAKNRQQHVDMDFMGEKSTSPIHCITRRYPQIVILKPFNSCPQICVYCQRNWEIQDIKNAQTTESNIQKAIQWIKNNNHIHEVLITGGDPFTLSNKYLDSLLKEVSAIPHVERIRIGTRVFVTVPFRIDDELVKILQRYHEFGKREICLVTHFEHAAELTPDSLEAIKKIKNAGMNIYNQQVFTYFNSFKFETSFLRKTLKLAGIDPYYCFNTKGKEETIDYRVPIARLEQERKEEARLLPGIVRTDESVFNVPKLGKSHLRALQDHELIMILKTGQRVIRFYPWESQINLVEDYLYTDVSIYDYLQRLLHDGEHIEEYSSIWYYF